MSVVRVPIEPHPLTADSMPAEGTVIGYTGRAFYGAGFAEHGYVSCAVRAGEHASGSAPGFYATVVDAAGAELFVLLGDEGRQVLHGYVVDQVALEKRS